MIPQKPVIAVIGAGAVGGYYGARLAQHGYDVHLHMRSDWETVRCDGMHIQSPDGNFDLSPKQIKAYESTTEMPLADLVIVTLKTTANDQLKDLIAPLLKPATAILTLQNGLGNEDRLAELFGAERVLGGMAFVCINRIGPGKIAHLDHGAIRIGEFQGDPSDRASQICAMFSASNVPCQLLANLMAGRWDKLVWNVPFNGLGAALDLTTDRLIGSKAGLARVEKIMREVIAAAAGWGIALPDSIIEQKLRYTRTMGAYSTSMQIDRRLGRPLETEAIIGAPLKMARQMGVVTPLIENVYELLNIIGP